MSQFIIHLFMRRCLFIFKRLPFCGWFAGFYMRRSTNFTPNYFFQKKFKWVAFNKERTCLLHELENLWSKRLIKYSNRSKYAKHSNPSKSAKNCCSPHFFCRDSLQLMKLIWMINISSTNYKIGNNVLINSTRSTGFLQKHFWIKNNIIFRLAVKMV